MSNDHEITDPGMAPEEALEAVEVAADKAAEAEALETAEAVSEAPDTEAEALDAAETIAETTAEIPGVAEAAGAAGFVPLMSPAPADKPAPAAAAAATATQPIPLLDELDDGSADALRVLEANRRARKRKRTYTLVIAGAVLAAIVIALIVMNLGSGSGGESGDAPPATTAVVRGDFESTVTGTGAARPLQMVSVTPEVSGIVETLNVTEGQQVNEGDVLLTLRNSDLDKAVNEASNTVRSAETGLNAAYSALEKAQARYNAALAAWNSAKTAEEQAQLEDPDIVWTEVEQAQIEVDNAQLAVDSAYESYNEAVEHAGKRTIRSPITGSVVTLNAEVGASYGTASETGQTVSGALAQIADISQMKVKLQINETDISKLSIGQKAKVTFVALPDVELDASVVEIATVSSGSGGEASFDGGGVVTYAVTLLIPQPVPDLKPGMTASATIVAQSVKDALLVPLSAIVDDGAGGSTLTVVELDGNGMVASSRQCGVKVLAKDTYEAAVEAIAGDELAEGDMVLIDSIGGMAGGFPGGDMAGGAAAVPDNAAG